ncbi:hypothetical protein DPMN_113985, partial [Dreissena polymorpha]
QCSSLPSIQSGSRNLTTDGVSTSVTFYCDSGATLHGVAMATCGQNGTWNVTNPECVSCPVLAAPASGSITLSTDGWVSRVLYSCNPGYHRHGNQMRECLATGNWTGTQPLCFCDLPTPPANGDVQYSTDNVTAIYSCATGYSLNGLMLRRCQSEGKGWNGTAPTCVACEQLTTMAGGYLRQTTDGFTTSAVYTCGDGYTMKGEANLMCRSDGSWSVQVPECVACNPLSQTLGSKLNMTTDGTVTQVKVECGVGYTLTGPSLLMCRSDGSWNYVLDSTACVKCPDLDILLSGSVSIATNGSMTMASYSCAPGYDLVGAPTVTCGLDGTWSSLPPVCKCAKPPAIQDGTYTVSTNGSQLTYSCSIGTAMIGNQTLSCDTSGLGWLGTIPSCNQCSQLAVPFNGDQTVSSDGLTTVATFRCNVNHTLMGRSTSSCLQNGSWSTPEPTCVPCSAQSSIPDGHLSLTTDGATTIAQYMCGVGFTLQGAATLACMGNGSWSMQQPQCVSCPTLSDIYNGGFSLTTNGSVTMAMYSCDSGYTLVVGAALSCGASGAWSGPAPTCVCSTFAQPENGAIQISSNGSMAVYTCGQGYTLKGGNQQECGTVASQLVGNTPPTCVACAMLNSTVSYVLSTDGSTTIATFQCGDNYTMVGQRSSQCRSDGTWSNTPPTCVTCPALTFTTGLQVTRVSEADRSVAHFSCKGGYSLLGAATLTCLTDRTWDAVQPTCVKCPGLTNPSSGVVNMTTDGLTSIATYTCSHGYHLEGDNQLMCNTSGQWEGTVPICKCDPPAEIANGSYVMSSNGGHVTYSCDQGYTVAGSQSRTCASNGTGWSNSEPSCVRCDDFSPPAGVTTSTVTDGSETKLLFTCGLLYSLGGTAVARCLPNGTWDIPATPMCVSCEPLTNVTNGMMSYTTNGTSTAVSIECGTGFTLSGKLELECGADGTWSSQLPYCVSCPTMSDILNGKIAMTTNGSVTMAIYSCERGYTLVGSAALSCRATGTWSGPAPTCVCSTFAQPANGAVQISSNGSVALYTCGEGYTLKGGNQQECGTVASQLVGNTPPTCVACAMLNSTTNYVLSTNGSTTSASFQCGANYTMVGQSSSQCRSDGTWSNTPPTCVTCPALTINTGLQVTRVSEAYRSVAHFSCKGGYTLLGAATLTCLTDRTWDAVQPACVKCPGLTNPTSGAVNMTTDGLTSIATYTCSHGYHLEGDNQLMCNMFGQWEGTVPVCKCDPPAEIANGSYVMSSNGGHVTYSCDQGYTMAGSQSRICASDGTGWSDSEPSCVRCENFSPPAGVTTSTVTNGSMTQILFTCGIAYSLGGTAVARCLPNGTWDIPATPKCVSCEPLTNVTNGTMLYTTNGTSTSVSIECGTGFTLSGKLELECGADGTWSSQLPQCVSCPSMATPQNGAVIVSNINNSARAAFSCKKGYKLIGEATLSCLPDATWSGLPPTCSCEAFQKPVHGNLSQSSNGTQAMVTCGEGYTLSGVSLIDCSVATALTTYTPPTCTLCQPLLTPTGYALSTDGSRTVALYSCEVGSTLVGPSTTSCRPDGTWDTSPPRCVTCDSLGRPPGGDVSLMYEGTATLAVFSCDVNHTLLGAPALTCRDDGSWNFMEPQCVKCPSLTPLLSGTINLTTDGTRPTARFSCTAGYHLDGVAMVTCAGSGNSASSWDSSIPTCKCDPAASLANGTMTTSPDGRTMTYTCNMGYSLAGPNSRLCTTNGTGWSGSQPSCVFCSMPTVPANGSLQLGTNGQSTVALVTCATGTTLSGQQNITCTSNGTWNLTLPSCVTCPSLMPLTSGKIEITSNGSVTMAAFTCNLNYTVAGDQRLTCQPDGKWSGSQPVCAACPSLKQVQQGAVVITTDGKLTSAAFSCNQGYQLTGSGTLQCTSDGLWDLSPPACVCKSFTQPTNGHLTILTNGSTAVYTCDAGYTLRGATTYSCDTTIGNTSLVTAPSCNTCNTLSVNPGVRSVRYSDSVKTYMNFSCDEGYTLVGEAVISCRSDGTWNSSLPICVICEELSSPYGGNITMTTSGSVTSAYVTCVSGFSLIGQYKLTCRSDGSWDFRMPTCECEPPAEPAHGSMSITGGLSAAYRCNVGYTLLGPAIRTCRADGTGWSGNEPSCEQCDDIKAGPNQNLTLVTDGHASQAVFQCDPGFSLSHSNNVTCHGDGTWDGPQPVCVRCPSMSTSSGLSYVVSATAGGQSVASFRCADGYSIEGALQVTCLRNGTWDTKQPTCGQSFGLTSGGGECSNSTVTALIVVFVLVVIVAVALGYLAWRYWRKYKTENTRTITYSQRQPIKTSPEGHYMFDDLDMKIPDMQPPRGHQRHITELGSIPELTSPPLFSGRHITLGGMVSPSMGPVTTRDIEIQKHPKSSYSQGSGSNDSFSTSTFESFLPVPKERKKHGLHSPTNRKPPEGSENESGINSPAETLQASSQLDRLTLPEQILTPRNPEELKAAASAKKSRQRRNSSKGGETEKERKQRKKSDLIDKDKDFLRVIKGDRSSSPMAPRTPSPYKISGTSQDYEVDEMDA